MKPAALFRGTLRTTTTGTDCTPHAVLRGSKRTRKAPQRTLLALVAGPRPRHEVESLERDRLPAALAPPVLLRPPIKPLERGVDLSKLRRLARRVHGIWL